MSHYILLEKISVENANAIAGITYGFPAITHFLGFTHALSRKLSAEGLAFDGCAVFCHDYKIDTYQRYREHYFTQKKTSPSALLSNRSKAHETPPIIEEGKMDMVVSIILRCEGSFGHAQLQEHYRTKIREAIFQSRLAGGSIFQCDGIHFYTQDADIRRIKRRLLPGFVLMDATDKLKKYIKNHSSISENNPELFDLWADFFTYRARAMEEAEKDPTDIHQKEKPNKKKKEVLWEKLPKPESGWFVPLMVGYKGISPLYDADEVLNLRDQRYPFRFVESVHSIGEWKGAHKMESLDDVIWQYDVKDEWYLCTQKNKQYDTASNSEALTQLVDDFFSSL